MVTMTVYANSDVFCWVVNILNKNMTCKWGDKKGVSLKQTEYYPYEIQVPIQIIGQFMEKDMTDISLYALQELNDSTTKL